MARDIKLSPADIALLREACAARGGVVRVKRAGELQTDFGRMVSAMALARFGYIEAAPEKGPDAWRIRPALKREVSAVLREAGG